MRTEPARARKLLLPFLMQQARKRDENGYRVGFSLNGSSVVMKLKPVSLPTLRSLRIAD